MAATREEYVYMAKLAEQAERYDEMVEFTEKVAAAADKEELTVEERNLLSVAYKNVIGARRASWRIVSSIEQKEESQGNEDHVTTIKEYRVKIETELHAICNGILRLLDSHLIPSASASDSKVFYLNMKGDYHRYLAEFKTGSDRKEAAENTLTSYKSAQDIALAELAPTHPIRLELALNFWVFDYEILNSPDRTCTLAKQIELAKELLHEGQSHLFANWAEKGFEDEKKICFFNQVSRLNANYPGGLTAYIQNARKLLADSKAGRNPFEGFTPSVPSGEVLTFGDDNFIMLEEVGVKEARKAAFVLVAGGLGERLGYKGIKVALPSETTTGTCFLQNYIECILALQEASCKLSEDKFPVEVPFVIMTSDDTHIPTLKLLESNSYFGMKPEQVKLLKQEKVACLDDNDARIALDPNDKYMIQTKPHGHGDVHSLLYNSGLLNIWRDAGLKWVLFFQDTNGLLFKAIPASLGVSVMKGYHVNSLAVPRKAKEAIGGITKLTHADGRTMVINVEYNQLDPLLRTTGHADGDANCETGYSPFPGNINQLILELGPYIEELNRTHGAIAEFVNPKYKDSSKTSFKSSTRLECMMQDYPKTLPPTARVGFTVMDAWLAYAPVKNNPEDAAKVPKGNPYHSATSGEMAIYRANSLILRKAGVQIADPTTAVFNGQEVEVWPRITWKPKWALIFSDVKRKVNKGCSISQRSTLVINGQNIYFEGLSLDGTLLINAVSEAEVKVTSSVQNKGWVLKPVDYKDNILPEESRIRGFVIEKLEQLEMNYNEPGKFFLQ